MLDVCLLGTGGMMPLPKRALTSLMTRYNGSSLLIDCGEGTQVSIREQGWSFHPIDTICITHTHGDHISGLPGLLLSMGNAERTTPLTIVGPVGVKRVVNALNIIAPGLPFELRFIELTEAEVDLNLNGYEIHAFRVNHNVTCYGYSVLIPRTGRFEVEKARENGVPLKAWNLLQKGEEVTLDGVTYTPDMVLGESRRGLKLTYCTDSRPTQGIVDNAKDADLFICEGMYGEPEKKAKAKEKKHMTFYEAAQLAKEARVSELWLTHYSPSLVNPVQYKDEVHKIFANTVIPKDRRSVTLNFDQDD